MLKIRFLFLAFFVSLVSGLIAQDNEDLVLSYQRNFIRSNLSTKLDLLNEAVELPGMGPLYDTALDFCLRNADLLRGDELLVRLAAAAAKGAALASDARTVNNLWRSFMTFRDTDTRVVTLGALSTLAKGDGQMVENLNQFLASQNNVFRTGLAPDLMTLSACIKALAALGDGASFNVLFSTMIAGYPENITLQAAEALKTLRGDYKKYLIDVVRKNPPLEKLAAFKAGAANEAFAPASRGELAEAALEVSLGIYPADQADLEAILELRYAAVRELSAQRWTRATNLAIKHFYQVQSDFSKGDAPKSVFIESIQCLSAMGSAEAAQALALQLGLLNAEMERSKNFDDDILSAVIQALGDLGDKVAFDYLLFIGYLPYPDSIKAAAREALNRLKW